MKKNSQNTSIRVFCRLRPLNKLEISQGGEKCVEYTEKAIKVKVAGEEKAHDFGFDGIFGPETAQGEVFNKVARPVIERLMEGYNGTIFAYGQTSSGKTFTMEGPDVVENEEMRGIIPRMMNYLFSLILNSSESIEFNVKVSFLELYNEKLQDLLDPRKNNLQIKEDKTKGIFVQDATEIYVNSAEQMRQVHKSGYENKTIAATRMNERSSRSHSIFILQVIQKDMKTETAKSSKLYFVDLAGSEKVAKTNVSGQQLEEAKNINKSLTSLGMVINALTEKEKGHVPYRDSKLTRLLQESLGGNSQTSLILACSMCSYNDKETLGTLRFGNRAKNIKNAPVVNVERSAKELTILLEAAEKKIKEQDEIIQSLQHQMDASCVSGNNSCVDMSLSNRDQVENMLEAVDERQRSPRSSFPQPQQQPSQFSFQIQPQVSVAETKSPGLDQPPNSLGMNVGVGSASLTLLKQHIQMTNLNEELQELRMSKKELENELAAKNQEVYDLTGKTMHFENQIHELTIKNTSTIEEYQVKLEKLCTDNQTNGMLMNKFRRAVSRLRSDLNFAFISKNLKMLDTDNKTGRSGYGDESCDTLNKEDLLMNSIQKTIEMLEEVEKDMEEKQETKSYTNEVEALIESFGANTEAQKKLFGRKSVLGTSSVFLKTTPTEILTTGTDEDPKIIHTIATEESAEEQENLKTEFDDGDDILQKTQFLSLNDEEKAVELQSLVAAQRRTISNLEKMNNELSRENNKHQSSQDKKIESYKIKIGDLQKFNAEKTKEYERKIQGLKLLLEEKIKELDDSRRKQEKDLLDKGKVLNDLKFQNDRMQKIILGNDLAKRVFDLETKIKEFALERQKLFEDLFKLRGEVDEKEEIIMDKSAQIQILQTSLNTFSSEIETMKHLRPQQTPNQNQKKDKKDSSGFLDGGKPVPIKKDTNFFDKNVVKPIRGGGGNVQNFERDNYLVFDKPSIFEPTEVKGGSKMAGRLQRMLKPDNGTPSADRGADGKNTFRKFDQILLNKGVGMGIMKGKTMTLQTMGNEEDDEDEPDYEDVREKLKVFSTKNNNSINDGQKTRKSFFSGMKSFFS